MLWVAMDTCKSGVSINGRMKIEPKKFTIVIIVSLKIPISCNISWFRVPAESSGVCV